MNELIGILICGAAACLFIIMIEATSWVVRKLEETCPKK